LKGDEDRIFTVKSEAHQYHFKRFDVNKHSVIIIDAFNPFEFNLKELNQLLTGQVLPPKRFILYPYKHKDIPASLVFISESNPLSRFNGKNNLDQLNKLKLIRTESFLGENIYTHVRIRPLLANIDDLDFETKIKFVNYFFKKTNEIFINFNLTMILDHNIGKFLKEEFLTENKNLD
jgi:hypothetical protein